MADGFVEAVAKEFSLNPQEYAVLQAAGVRSFEDVHSLVHCFPSIAKAGVRLPIISNFALMRTGKAFAENQGSISK
jgi:hypothetical protein